MFQFAQWMSLFFVRALFFLDGHVAEFARVENVAAFLAFHVFGFFIAGNDAHTRMFAQFRIDFTVRGGRRLAERHKLVDGLTVAWKWNMVPKFSDILRRLAEDVKYRRYPL